MSPERQNTADSFHGDVRCRLTFRAQAREADDVLRDSGTGLSRHSAATAEVAIPRCLQRFVRLPEYSHGASCENADKCQRRLAI
jgi:hypothetical protein